MNKNQMTQTELQSLLQADLDQIYIGNCNTIEADLELPLQGAGGTRFTWESDQPWLLDEKGHVERPDSGKGDRRVFLTVTGRLQGEVRTRVFECHVLERSHQWRTARIFDVTPMRLPDGSSRLPQVVVAESTDGRKKVFPNQWDLVLQSTQISGKAGARQAEENRRKAEHSGKLSQLALTQISLLPGTRFYEAEQAMLSYLLRQNPDTLLHQFRAACGLSTRGAAPMQGWDAPDCKLKGHTTGHTLAALALAYAKTQDERFFCLVSELIEGLAECQEAFAARGMAPGFLSAYDEEQFALLERYTRYPEIWAPYYTLEKLLTGILDCYEYAGSQLALKVASGIGEWIYRRLSKLSPEQRSRMWSMYIAGEVGAMMYALTRLYEMTGRSEFYQAAGYFTNDSLLYPMSVSLDVLNGIHANQHIPQAMGAWSYGSCLVPAEEKASREPAEGNCYQRAAEEFWRLAAEHHSLANGGVGEGEMFRREDQWEGAISERSAESCASFHLLRLTSQLFRSRPASGQMDYYENTLYNHLAAGYSHTVGDGTTYFLSMKPRSVKEFDSSHPDWMNSRSYSHENSCCHGTGLESRFRYQQDIYSQGTDSLWLNLYLPSKLQTESEVLTLRELPVEGCVSDAIFSYRLEVEQWGKRQLYLRIPSWAKAVSVVLLREDNTDQEALLPLEMERDEASGYWRLQRCLQPGDCLEIRLSSGWYCRLFPENDRKAALFFGPWMLVETESTLDREQVQQSDETAEFPMLPGLEHASLHQEQERLTIKAEGRSFVPWLQVEDEVYEAYFRLS